MRLSVNGLKKAGIVFLITTLACCSLLIPVKSVRADAIQPAIWIMDDLNITQVPGGDYSHAGTLNFDIKGVRNPNIKAPFDCKIVAVFPTKESGNTVIIQSISPVRYADGTVDYMSMAVGHDEDISDCINDYNTGRIISQGEVFYQNGKYGVATGIHTHVTCIRGKYTDHPNWVQVSTGNSTFHNAIDPTTAFFVDPETTETYDNMGLIFEQVDEVPPTMISPDISVSNITGKSFDVSFKVSDNILIGEVYIKLMTSAGSRFGNFATIAPIQGTYDPSSKTASVSVELSNLGILSDLYYIQCYGKDIFGNISDPLRLKEPVSPFFISAETCGQYKALKETPILNYPGTTAYPGASQSANQTIAKGEKVNVLGTITIDGVRYHKIEADQYEGETGSLWVKADDMEYYESLLTKIWNWIQEHADELICNFGHKVISLREDGTVKQSGTIIASAKEYFSAAYVESLADSGTAITPQENTEYSIEFNTVNEEITITIAGYQGYGGNVTVPEEIGGYQVTAIKSGAFSNCSNIVSITLPEGITSIPENCFRNCISLTRAVLPSTVNTIGSYAFYGCEWLTELDLPESVTEIGNYAFSGCGIKDLVIPSGVTSINYHTFSNCKNLETLVIPDSVRNLYVFAFYNCDGLREVTLPGDTDYGRSDSTGPFTGCSGIEKVTYTKGQSGIVKGNYSTQRKTGPISIAAEGSLKEVVFEEGITEIEAYALMGSGGTNGDGSYTAGIESITWPSTLEKIGTNAFQYQDNLTELDLPESVTEIGSYAFSGCGVTNLIIPSGVTAIYTYTFSECKSLETLVIPDSVRNLYAFAFYNCDGLREVTLPGDTDYGSSDGTGPFTGCSGIEKVTYTKGQSGIVKGNYSTQRKTGPISIAAEGSLKEVVFEEGITEIEAYALMGSGGTNGDGSYTACVESITWPSTLEKIGERAFQYQDDLTELDLPEGLTSIGANAFAGCMSLSDIRFTGSAPAIQSTALSSVTATAYYPGSNTTWTDSVRQNYGGNITWVDSDQPEVPLYDKTLTLPTDLKTIDSESFSGLTQGVNVVVPNTVTHIEGDAFDGSSVVIIAEPGGYVEEFCNEHGIPFHAR